MAPKDYRERRVYYFKCGQCEKRRQSFLRRKAKLKVCRKCLSNRVNPNQQTLFPV